MCVWKEYEIGKGAYVFSGFAFKSKDLHNVGEIPIIKIGNLQNKKVSLDKTQFVDEEDVIEKHQKYFLQNNDILIAMTGQGSVGRVSRLYCNESKKILLNQRVGKFVCDEDILNNLYLYYVISSDKYQELLFSAGSGSGQPNLSPKLIESVKIPFPPLETQKQISKILSSIDDKIELNNKINDNLEQQAQAILQDWESNNIEDLKTCKIDDVAEINSNNYSPKENWQYVNYLDTSSITSGILTETQYIDLLQDKIPSRAKRKVNAGEIVYSTVRPNQLHFGLINNPLVNMLVSTGFAVINSINPNINNEFLYLQLTKLDVVEKLQQIGEQSTSTFPAIKPSDIGNLSILLPNEEDATMMKVLKSKFALIANNQQQNQKLAQLRDTLLPKLMNGEIDVSQVEV